MRTSYMVSQVTTINSSRRGDEMVENLLPGRLDDICGSFSQDVDCCLCMGGWDIGLHGGPAQIHELRRSAEEKLFTHNDRGVNDP
jgi:hypothetical protein